MKKGSFCATALALMLSLTACGGGSDSSTTDTTDPTDTTDTTPDTSGGYSGVTTAAVITQSTSVKLTGLILSSASRDESGATVSLPAKLSSSNKTELLAGVTNTSLPGDCGGSMTVGSTSTTATATAITYTYTNYCISSVSGTMVTNGTMTLVMDSTYTSTQTTYNNFTTTSTDSVSAITDTSSINGSWLWVDNGDGTYTHTYTNFQLTSNGLTNTYNGSWTINTTTGDVLATYTYEENGKVYRAENYSVITDGSGTVASVSGTLYDPDEGYVVISTTQPFTYDAACPGTPVSGTLEITGSGDKTAAINMLSCTSYQVCIDDSCSLYDW